MPTSPPSVLPCAQPSDGSRYTIARTRPYNYLRNSGFWFNTLNRAGTFSLFGNQLVGTTTGRDPTFDGWGMTASETGTERQAVDRLTLNTPTADYRQPYYAGKFGLAAGLIQRRFLISQAIESIDVVSMREQVVRFQAKVMVYPAQWPFGGGINSPGYPSTNIVAGGRIRIALAMLSGGTADSLPATFVTNFGLASSDVIPILGTGLSYIAPLTRGVDGGTREEHSIVTSGLSPQELPRLLPRGMRVGGLWRVPASAQNLVVMIWTDRPIRSTGDNNQFMTIHEPSLTVGEIIPEFSPMSTELELARCRRFCCGSFSQTTNVPAQNAGLAGVIRGLVNANGTASGQVVPVRFPVPMRAAPTITTYNPSAANAFVRNTVLGTDATATSSANVGQHGADITFTGVGGGGAWAAGQAVAVHFIANAEL